MLLFTAALSASLLMGLASALFGFGVSATELSTGEAAAMLLYAAGRAVSVGLACGLLLMLAARLHRVRPALALLFIWALLAAGFVWSSWELLDGARIAQHKHVGLMRIALRAGGPLLLLVLCWGVQRFCLRRISTGQRSRVLIGCGAVTLALLLARSDVRILPGLYPGLHALLAGSAVCAAIFGLILLRNGAAGRAGHACALAALLIFGASLFLQGSAGFESARASAVEFTRITTPFRALTEPLYGLFSGGQQHSAADVKALLEAARRSGQTDFSSTLDRLIPQRRNFNVLLVAMDTVRFDHTGLGGYAARNTTPHLDRFARDAYVFPRTWTPYPTSNYAYNALLTALAAGTTPLHGHRSRFDWNWNEDIHFPRLLAKAGMHSTGIAAFEKKDRLNERFFGYVEKGFDVFNADQSFDRPMTGAEIRDSALKRIVQRGDKPFFLFVHWLDPHDPYETRPEFDFGSDTVARYDSEIAWTDAQFGALLDCLAREGLADRTIVAVFSDHGEALGEHGLTTHNSSLFECETRVPLVLRVPGLPGGSVDATASLIDLMPTILALRGTADTQPRMGASLLPWMLEPGRHPERTAFSEQFTVRQGDDYLESRCVVHDQWKLIESVEKPVSTFRLFDLRTDPGEARNRFTDASAAERRATMLGLLEAAVAARKAYKGDAAANDPAAALAAETRALLERLRSTDAQASRKAGAELRNALKSRYGDLSERHARLDPALLKELRAAAEAAFRGSDPPRWELLEILQVFESPESAALWRELLTHANPRVRLEAAIGLAHLGDAAAKPVLEAGITLLNDATLAFPAALALAHLGVPVALENYALILRGDSTPEVAPLLRALTAARNPCGLQTLYERLLLNTLHDYKLKARAIEYAAAAGGYHAPLVLAWLADDADAGVRAAAMTSLKMLLGGKADEFLTRERLEREALGALLNGKARLAVDTFVAYIAKYPDADARIWMNLARARIGLDDRAGVREALEQVCRRGDAIERTAATRMLAHADELRWFFQPDAGEWDAGIEVLTAPSSLIRNRSFALRVRLTNRGGKYWPGGCWVFAPELRTDIVDAQGALFRSDAQGRAITRREIANYLPLTGVEPGESIELLLAGHVPSGQWTDGRIVLGFHQHGTTHIPQSGRWIWTSPDAVQPR